jgi:hypothetical protein
MHYDPAQSQVELQHLVVKLQEALSRTSQPNFEEITMIATEIREQASDIRLWSFEKMNHVKT